MGVSYRAVSFCFPRRCGAKDSWKLSSAVPQGTWRWLQRRGQGSDLRRVQFGAKPPGFRWSNIWDVHILLTIKKDIRNGLNLNLMNMILDVLFACRHFFWTKKQLTKRHLQLIYPIVIPTPGASFLNSANPRMPFPPRHSGLHVPGEMLTKWAEWHPVGMMN